MPITFLERYQSETTWYGKVTVMGLFHMAMGTLHRGWTMNQTAEHFNCSLGLVSENLRLSHALHANEKLMQCPTRQDALKKAAIYARKSGS